jgi:hypothetical protein
MHTRRRLLAAIILGIPVAGVTSRCSARDRFVPLGTAVRHDDFLYSIRGTDRRARIGDRAATGVFQIVDFQIDNQAKRVTHDWRNDIVFLIDDRGRTYDNDAAAQRALARLEPFPLADRHSTPAGSIDRTKLVFDVPSDAGDLCARFRGEFLMGDLFDGSQFLHTKVRLR